MFPCFVRCAILNSSPPPGGRPLPADPAGWLSTCFRALAMWEHWRFLEKLHLNQLAIILQSQNPARSSFNISKQFSFVFLCWEVLLFWITSWCWQQWCGTMGQQWGGDGDSDGGVIMVVVTIMVVMVELFEGIAFWSVLRAIIGLWGIHTAFPIAGLWAGCRGVLKLTEIFDCPTHHCPLQKHAFDRDLFDLFSLLFWAKGRKRIGGSWNTVIQFWVEASF